MHFHRDMLAICDSYGRARAARRAATTSSSARRRSPSPSGSAAWCCSRCASALHGAAGEGGAGRSARGHRAASAPRSASPRRPPTARCSASSPSTTSHRCANASRPARPCRRPRSTPGRRRPASRSSTASARPRCCTSSSARPRTRSAPGATGRPVPGYEARIVDDDGNEVAARHGRPARGARADRLPLSRRRAPAEVRAERLEPHRRHLPDGRRRLLLVSGPLRRHDHLVRLQHRRPRGRERRCSRIRRSPNAAWSARRTRSAGRSSRPTSCCAPAMTGDAALTKRCRIT